MNMNHLSNVQKRAVTTTEGPVLVLAGAGSGKTTVLTNRVAYLIEEKGIAPYRLLAITFTNKAAKEMKERIERIVSEDVSGMVISTFHAMCARFLRRDAESIGYTNQFTIYDTDMAQALLKKILAEKGVDSSYLSPKTCLSYISSAKNASAKMTIEAYFEQNAESEMAETLSEVFAIYKERLQQENAMDFDDLLCNMLRVLQESQAAREYYTNRFQYIMVDEYQDTNSVQYELVKILAERRKNLFVVGDDDQSIYAWRGADIRNILDFEKDYKEATVIKLEENYRSHSKILDAANAVIQGAEERKQKTLWSARKEGEKPKVFAAKREYDEAEFIAREIGRKHETGISYEDIAVLYRTHSQSRMIEEKLRTYGVPYQIYGGISFYERKEIRDMIAYLTILNNPDANTALLRIINTPRRGIGEASLSKLSAYAEGNGTNLLSAVKADIISGKAGEALREFSRIYDRLAEEAEEGAISALISDIFVKTGYHEMVQKEGGVEAQVRKENVAELIRSAEQYEREHEEASLDEYLTDLSLITSMDTTSDTGAVTLMTMHSAKGLEFDTVFLAGMARGIFPSRRSVEEHKTDEERRLCYVGITRAKNTLYFTYAEERFLYGGMMGGGESSFLQEIPPSMKEDISPERNKPNELKTMPSFTKKIQERPKVTFQKKAEEQRDASQFREGMEVSHPTFGTGKILSIAKAGKNTVAVIRFEAGEKKMFLEFAPISIL